MFVLPSQSDGGGAPADFADGGGEGGAGIAVWLCLCAPADFADGGGEGGAGGAVWLCLCAPADFAVGGGADGAVWLCPCLRQVAATKTAKTVVNEDHIVMSEVVQQPSLTINIFLRKKTIKGENCVLTVEQNFLKALCDHSLS